MLEITCPSCNRKLGMPESAIGKQVRCPACNTVFQVAEPPATMQPYPPQPAPQQYAPPPAPPQYAPPPGPPPQYDYGRGGDAEYGRGRGEAFDFDEGRGGGMQGLRGRTLAGAAANWMMTAGIINIVVGVLIMLGVFISPGGPGGFGGLGGRGGAYAAGLIGGLVCVLILVATPTVFIMIAAGQLRSLRGKGLVITGAVMAFVVGGFLVLGALLNIVAVLQVLGLGIPVTYILLPFVLLIGYVAGAICNIIGGVKTLVALNNPAVRDAYR